MGTPFVKKTKFLKKSLNKKFEKKYFGPNLHQAKSGVTSFSLVMGAGVSGVKKNPKLLRII